jgi:hypothetical protein
MFGGLQAAVGHKASGVFPQLDQVFAALAAEAGAGQSAPTITAWIDWLDAYVRESIHTAAAQRAKEQAEHLSHAYRLGQVTAYSRRRLFTFYERESVIGADGRPSSSSAAILASCRAAWATHWG